MKRWLPVLFCLIHVYSVSLSHSTALCAVHGASGGTEVDIWSSCATVLTMSAAAIGSGGALPVMLPSGPLSVNRWFMPPAW